MHSIENISHARKKIEIEDSVTVYIFTIKNTHASYTKVEKYQNLPTNSICITKTRD